MKERYSSEELDINKSLTTVIRKYVGTDEQMENELGNYSVTGYCFRDFIQHRYSRCNSRDWLLKMLKSTKVPSDYVRFAEIRAAWNIHRNFKTGEWKANHERFVVETDRYTRNAINEVRRFKNKVKSGLETVGKWDAEIREDLKNNSTALDLLDGMEYDKVAMRNQGEGTFDLGIKLKAARAVINTPTAYRVVSPTTYTIKFLKSGGSYLYEDISGSVTNGVGGSTNPHVGGGRGGGACLGGFAYSIAQCLQKKQWFQAFLTLKEFHTQVNTQDEWGRHIHRAPRLFKVAGMKDEFINSNSRRDNCKVDEMYFTGKQALPMDDYVQCAVTGKKILRINAVRLPIYASAKAIRDGRLPHTLTSKWDHNRPDKRRMMRAKTELTIAHHRKSMNKYYQEALDYEEQQRKMMLKRMSAPADVVLTPHAQREQVRTNNNYWNRDGSRRRA